ncbi:MAG: ATP-binding cassette domain-containing protein [Clostridia bacterium]|nr:ATP-binding cassette domain-containing protein [Clostridia bacterium]
MAELSLKHIYKVYPARNKHAKNKEGRIGNDFVAVKDFCMDIQDGEFIVFVGPSGCGKSTTLRMIAGLEDISSGELYIDGKLMNMVEPRDRNIAMVFQSYALYPHMTAYDNIAFGLRMRKVPSGEVKIDKHGKEVPVMRNLTKEEIDEKVQWAANILSIQDLLASKPEEMSGGQRQRIALGRAMVREPKVFLLDEPLSNLDAKLRTQMRSEIVKLHNEIGTTFIYVTHDQVEAMTMGTRIVVMKDGVIQQIDTPTNLFDYPANKFVASFIGTPQMNFFNVKMQAQGEELFVEFADGQTQTFSLKNIRPFDEAYLDGATHEVVMGVRGEHMHLTENGVEASVSITEVLGSTTHVFIRLADQEYIVCLNERVALSPNDKIQFSFEERHLHFFDKQTEQTILRRWE